jgi:outer membrane immunogenic protein
MGLTMPSFKSLVLATTALSFGLIGAASAADMRARPVAAPMAAPVPYTSWAGFYIGGHAGGGWIESGNTAFVGGGQVGYNWQFAPNWILGIEADISGADWGGTNTVAVPGGTLAVTSDLNWLASVRGRLGYTWDRYMLYFTGGGAWADLGGAATLTIPGVGTSTATTSAHASGWVIGGGAEWMFAPNWILGVEYLHYTFDRVSGTVAGPAGTASFNFTGTDGEVDVVRGRLSYKFGDFLR